MSIHPVTLEDALNGGRKNTMTPVKPANDTSHSMSRERFPKVEDIVDRLTETTQVADTKGE